MALSPQDKEFYQQKLGLKSLTYLLSATAVVGAIAWPLLSYAQTVSDGAAVTWNSTTILGLAATGFLLGAIVSVAMYLIFKMLLELEWLPRRR